ncbi:MAG: DUF4476 domain-containing protein [Myxococcales bacterium]|jgi:hypothetical protein
MSRALVVLSLSLFAASAFAQDISFHAGPNGISMHANIPDEEVQVSASSTQTSESSSEGYRLTYQTDPGGATLMKVLAPEGAQCQVWDGRKLIAEDDIPMSFRARPERFYRIVVKMPGGQVWEKKLAAKRGQAGSLWVSAPPPPPPPPPPAPAPQVQTQVVVREVHHVHHKGPPPPPPARPARPVPMAPQDVAALKTAISAETFSNQKLQVLETAVPSTYFTVAQVGQIVDLFDFENDKVKAVEIITVQRIVDRQNAFQLYSHFEFDNYKSQVKKLLAQ